MPKPMHQTERPLRHAGAVDADGHILEPPDLWETYIDPKHRDRALRFELDDNGLEELWIGGERSLMSRNGRSEEHTSELQSLMRISYAVFCLKKKKMTNTA